MAKLNFKYASMNAGKSIDLMKTAYNYEENGYKVIVLKPEIDTKAGKKIQSRVAGGLERKVDYIIGKDDNIIEILKNKLNNIKCILIDEAQFLSKRQIDQLYIITKSLDIAVIAYGLRTNFKMEFFEGSKRLMELSEELEELKTICSCGYTAKFVGRKINGEYVSDGTEVVIDGETNIEYVPLCGKCYLEKVKHEDLAKVKKYIR